MDFTYTFSKPIKIETFFVDEITVEKFKDKNNVVIFKINFYDKTNNKYNYAYIKSSGKLKVVINENKFLLFYTTETRILFIYSSEYNAFKYVNALYYEI